MTGIPTPHEPDEHEDLIIPGPKETYDSGDTANWMPVPGKPGFWKHIKTGELKYIPPLWGVPQTP
jgi:hypothetical protein